MDGQLLAGRVAFVTGAGRGIGRNMARWLAAAGAAVVICARSRGDVDALADELRSFGVHVLAEPCDVSDAAAVQKLVDHATGEFGGIDLAVANAGILGPVGTIENGDPNEWNKVFQVNVGGSAAVARAVLPGMRARGHGRIVTVSGGGVGGPNIPARVSAYVASKAAVMALTEALAKELPHGVTVNSIAPGPVPTDFNKRVLDAGPSVAGDELFDSVRAMKPPDLEPLRDLLFYIASDESSWLNGRCLSARWEPPSTLRSLAEGGIDESRFRLRRIDEDLYRTPPGTTS